MHSVVFLYNLARPVSRFYPAPDRNKTIRYLIIIKHGKYSAEGLMGNIRLCNLCIIIE